MKILLIIIAGLLVLISCERVNDKTVKYLITNSISEYNVNYLNDQGELIKDVITANSAQDEWTYSYVGNEGDIVFVSTIYKDIHSAIKVQILIDGKVYKEGSSTHDTVKYVTVSGTIPYK